MDSFSNYNPDDERSYPAAPKGNSGPDDAPIGPDHNPPSGGYVPNDESWAGGAAFPLSSPYSGMSSGEPPAPIFRPELDSPGVARGGFPSRTDVGARNRPTNRRRMLAGIGAFLLLVLVIGGLAFVLLGNGGTSHPTANGGNSGNGGNSAPVIVGTDTPTPTPTLLPGQTPLPTAVPPTPLPAGAAPPPYASSASVSFKRATQGYSVPSTLTAAISGGDIAATPEHASVSQVSSGAIGAANNSGSYQVATLTITNNTDQDWQSAGNIYIQSVSGRTYCVLQGTATVPAHTNNVQQSCNEPTQPEQAESYSYSRASPPLIYNGGASAGGQSPYFYVPNNCASTGQGSADTAAQGALKSQLDSKTPSGSVVFSAPVYSIDNTSLACSPSAGTQQSSYFTYVVNVNGTADQTSYRPGDAIAFQQNRVKNSVGSGYQYISASVCSSPSVSSASSSSATITCSASGTEAWNVFNLGGMAQLIRGQTQGSAVASLNAVQGVVANSETFSLSGGSYLPTNGGNISFHYSP